MAIMNFFLHSIVLNYSFIIGIFNMFLHFVKWMKRLNQMFVITVMLS